MFGLVEGYLDVLIAAGPYPPFLAYVGRPGWWVGEAAAVTGSPRRAEVQARTQARVLYLSAAQLEKMTERHPDTWRRLALLSVEHMDNALMLASTLVRGGLREKVLATLHRLSGSLMDVDAWIELPCKQSEIAEMAGLSRNSVGPQDARGRRTGPAQPQ